MRGEHPTQARRASAASLPSIFLKMGLTANLTSVKWKGYKSPVGPTGRPRCKLRILARWIIRTNGDLAMRPAILTRGGGRQSPFPRRNLGGLELGHRGWWHRALPEAKKPKQLVYQCISRSSPGASAIAQHLPRPRQTRRHFGRDTPIEKCRF